jgi:acetylornithine/succinyldiaminopimelate/putrescine aminotransferase
MGRTGHWFGYQAYGIQPDAFSVAKALGNGFPIGAVVSGSKLADVFQPGKHASTFGGTPLACAAALAAIEVIEAERLVDRAASVGQTMLSALGEMADKYEHVQEARGRGLMLGLVLDQAAKPLVEAMAEVGLLAIATAENVVRFLPPLTVKDSEVEEALDIVDECLAEMHGVSVEEEEEEEEQAAAAASPAESEEEAAPAAVEEADTAASQA